MEKNSEEDKQAWRMDPSESMSDYSIEIHSTKESGEGAGEVRKDVYHVHKAYLSLGPYFSRYFKSLFTQKKESNYSENQNEKSLIELPRAVADVFPAWLDCIYSQGRVCSFTDDPIALVGVFFLSDYFDSKGARGKCLILVGKNVSSNDFHKSYELALKLNLSGILEKIEMLIPQNHKIFHHDHLIWSTLTVDSMKKVTASNLDLLSITLCNMIIAFLEQTNHKISDDDFYCLTKNLDTIDFSVAFKMINLENKIAGNRFDPVNETPLRKKCLETISENIIDIPFHDQQHEYVQCLINNPSKTAMEMLINHFTYRNRYY